MNKLFCVLKQSDCIESNHYISDNMLNKLDFNGSANIVLANLDSNYKIINWMYIHEIRQYE